MKLKEINKLVYRANLNKVIISFVITLALLSLVFGQILIYFFADVSTNISGTTDNTTAEAPSNFRYNLLGVILALLACAAILHQLREKLFFTEIYYVWQLKQVHNLIYRRLVKIKAAAAKDDVNAIVILNYYYKSLKQVYLLDDNTLTMSKLEKDIKELDEIIMRDNLSISTEQFDKTLIAAYK